MKPQKKLEKLVIVLLAIAATLLVVTMAVGLLQEFDVLGGCR